MDIYPGLLVVSTAGRDQGKYFIVTKVIDENFVLISDGKVRRAEKPKRKKIKHIKSMGLHSERLVEKLGSGSKLTNPELRKSCAHVLSHDEMKEG